MKGTLLRPPVSFVKHSTLATNATACFAFTQVWRHKFMTSNTMSFSFVLGAYALAAKYILGACYGLKMVGIYTVSHPAKMVDLKPIWDGTLCGLVSYPMNVERAPTYPNLSMSSIFTSLPKPTGFSFYRSFQHSFKANHSMLIPKTNWNCL